MTKDDPDSLPDFSDIFDAVGQLTNAVNSLHTWLDAFTAGKAAKLSGNRVRRFIGDDLANLDEQLKRLDAFREAGQQQVRGAITATHVSGLRSVKFHFDRLNQVLYALYFDRHSHNISEEQHGSMTHHIRALRNDLDQLLEDTGLDKPDDATAA